MHFHGCYINLDRSNDRRVAMERQIADIQAGNRYQRIAAVEGRGSHPTSSGLTAGEVACFMSHTKALREAAQRDLPTHVLEDDAVIAPVCITVLDHMIQSGVMQDVDMLFTETYVPIDLEYIREYKSLFDQSVEYDSRGSIVGLKHVHLMELRGRIFFRV